VEQDVPLFFSPNSDTVDNPIVLEEDESDTSEIEVDHASHRAESAEPDAGLFSGTKTAFDSRTSVPPSLERYDSTETAHRT
jgi:hypothetical protein